MRRIQKILSGIFIISLQLVFPFSSEPAASWTDLNAPSKSDLKMIGNTNKGTLLVGSENGLIYRSTDKGIHWAKTNNTRSYSVRAFLSTDSVIYASRSPYPSIADCFNPLGCGGPNYSSDLLISKDDGKTWKSSLIKGITALTKSSTGEIWAISKGKIYKQNKLDSGWSSWNLNFENLADQPSPMKDWIALVWALFPERLTLLCDKKLYSATFDSKSKTCTVRLIQFDKALALGVYHDRPFVATEIGLHGISNITSFGMVNSYQISSLAFNNFISDSTGNFFGNTINQLYEVPRSADTTLAWGTKFPDKIIQAIQIDSTALVLAKDNSLWIASKSGTWKQTGLDIHESLVTALLNDDGETFAGTYLGLSSLKLQDKNWQTSLNNKGHSFSKLVRAGNDLFGFSPYISRRDALSEISGWTSMPSVNPTNILAVGTDVVFSDVFYSPDDTILPNVISVCQSGSGICRTTSHGLFGSSALIRGLWFFAHNMTAIASSPTGVLIAADTAIYRSWDRGLTWDTIPIKNNLRFARFTFLKQRLIAETPQECNDCQRYSDDLGETWTKAPRTGLKGSIIKDGLIGFSEAIYAATETGVYISLDGLTWKSMYAPLGEAVTSMAIGNGFITIGTSENRLYQKPLDQATLSIRNLNASKSTKSNFLNFGFFQDASGFKRRIDGKLNKRNTTLPPFSSR